MKFANFDQMPEWKFFAISCINRTQQQQLNSLNNNNNNKGFYFSFIVFLSNC